MGKKRAVRNAQAPPESGAQGSVPQWYSLGRVLANPLFHLAVIAIIGMLAYGNSFGVPFVIDDEGSILENPAVKNLSSFLFEGEGFRYNPRRFVGYLTLAVNYRLGGVEVAGYHVFNLAVHLINASLVYAFLRLTLKTPIFETAAPEPGAPGSGSALYGAPVMLPLLAALFFVAHPIQTQAVTYVVQRLASLATLFYLATLVCYVSGRVRKSPLFYLAAALFALCAFFTKEISATLPVTLLLYEFSFFGASRRKFLILGLPLAAASLLATLWLSLKSGGFGALLEMADAASRETDGISRGDYLLTQLSVLVTYLRLIVFPVGQNLDYDYPLYHTLFTPRVFGSLLLLAALLYLAVELYRRSARGSAGERDPWLRLAGFGILWFFVTISVESGVIPIRDLIFEHRVYLPSVGLFSAVATLCTLLARRFPAAAVVRGAGVVILVLAALTWQRNQVWGDAVGFWQDCVRKSPGKLRPRNNLASALLTEGRVAEAVEQLKVSLRIEPQDPVALRTLGVTYEMQGRLDLAVEAYRSALKARPDNKYAHYNLGIALVKQGAVQEALAEFSAALRLDPEYADAHNNLGVIHAGMGETQKAVELFRLAVRFDPGSGEARLNLGRALGEQGKGAEALAELERAARLQPDNAEVYNNMGIIHAGAGRRAEAAEQFKKAAALKPGDPRYLDNLYRLQLQGG